ncbi:MAG TPA: LysR family transcriptional regulator [Nocardioides sp.]|uniref:LysR family transcriptional regulator n=1 Tax=Nocardioides sp. TaxID=35761 RepID=UPI002E346D62|nr:LysR family transcriptional regulator [Nocardioides sp.]HEX5088956.1 LysR family transcriptional regulator [Nocardioides sp.]
MDLRRLQMLLDLSRLGSMREVAAGLGTTTSSVSQAIAALAREVGTPLVEPDGRRVRLTPAGHRLAEHAVTILAGVDAARLDLDPGAEPIGVVRVAGFATAIRLSLLPAVAELAPLHPGVELQIVEQEPPEALDLLARDDVDLALTYDYNLAPASWLSEHHVTPLWDVEWGLGVPTSDRRAPFASYADHDWIVNSRHTADEDVLRTLASLTGFTPRVTHRVDALELVDDLIAARLGVALLPRGRTSRRGVTVRPLKDPSVWLRGYAVSRRGRDRWPPLRVVLEQLTRADVGAPDGGLAG